MRECAAKQGTPVALRFTFDQFFFFCWSGFICSSVKVLSRLHNARSASESGSGGLTGGLVFVPNEGQCNPPLFGLSKLGVGAGPFTVGGAGAGSAVAAVDIRTAPVVLDGAAELDCERPMILLKEGGMLKIVCK